MDVFGGGILQEIWVSVQLIGDELKCRQRVAHFDFGEDADPLQRFRPRAIDIELIRQKPTIERKGALERIERFVRFALEAAAPEAVILAFGCGLIGHEYFGSLVARVRAEMACL